MYNMYTCVRAMHVHTCSYTHAAYVCARTDRTGRLAEQKQQQHTVNTHQ